MREKKRSLHGWMTEAVVFFFFFPVFSCCSKIGDQPQEGLAKLGYKTKNREIENLRILYTC